MLIISIITHQQSTAKVSLKRKLHSAKSQILTTICQTDLPRRNRDSDYRFVEKIVRRPIDMAAAVYFFYIYTRLLVSHLVDTPPVRGLPKGWTLHIAQRIESVPERALCS